MKRIITIAVACGTLINLQAGFFGGGDADDVLTPTILGTGPALAALRVAAEVLQLVRVLALAQGLFQALPNRIKPTTINQKPKTTTPRH